MQRITWRTAMKAALCGLAAMAAASAQRVPDLDLTTLDRPIEEVSQEGSSHGIAALPERDGRKIEDFLRVRLVGLEPNTCVYGESMLYDVELSNIGRTPLLIPWSVDRRDQGEATNGFYPVVSFSLEYREGRSRGVLDAGDLLFGNRFNSLSTRTLRPKQSVVIRAAARCGEIGGTQASFAPASRHLEVIARIGLHYGESPLGPTTVSGNSMALTLNWPN